MFIKRTFELTSYLRWWVFRRHLHGLLKNAEEVDDEIVDFEDVAEDDVTFGVASEFLRAKRRQRKSENLHEEGEEEEKEKEGGG